MKKERQKLKHQDQHPSKNRNQQDLNLQSMDWTDDQPIPDELLMR